MVSYSSAISNGNHIFEDIISISQKLKNTSIFSIEYFFGLIENWVYNIRLKRDKHKLIKEYLESCEDIHSMLKSLVLINNEVKELEKFNAKISINDIKETYKKQLDKTEQVIHFIEMINKKRDDKDFDNIINIMYSQKYLISSFLSNKAIPDILDHIEFGKEYKEKLKQEQKTRFAKMDKKIEDYKCLFAT
jgi:hypothetical protein